MDSLDRLVAGEGGALEREGGQTWHTRVREGGRRGREENEGGGQTWYTRVKSGLWTAVKRVSRFCWRVGAGGRMSSNTCECSAVQCAVQCTVSQVPEVPHGEQYLVVLQEGGQKAGRPGPESLQCSAVQCSADCTLHSANTELHTALHTELHTADSALFTASSLQCNSARLLSGEPHTAIAYSERFQFESNGGK